MRPTSMRALVFTAKNKVELAEVPVPTPGPLDALVRTTASSICTSDFHTAGGAIDIPPGRVLGHESTGIVESVGALVTRVGPGDRVVAPGITSCGRCDYCQTGFPNQCGGILGGFKWTTQRDGNLSEYFVVTDADYNLAVIPDGIPDERAVYAADALSTGFAGAEAAAIPLGGTVAVFSQGPIGLCAVMGARLLGAGLVITTATRPERAELSRHFGADVVIDPRAEDAVDRIMAIAGGDGVDSAIEALGTPETFEDAIRVTRAGGNIVNLGYHGWRSRAPLPIPLVPYGMGMSQKTIHAVLSKGGRVRMERIMRLMRAGRIDPSPLTTHRFAFDDVERAFEMMRSKSDGIVKAVLTYQGDVGHR